MLCLESSDVSAVSADLQALGFQSGAGINPGRMIRVVHTVVRSFATIVRVRDAPLHRAMLWRLQRCPGSLCNTAAFNIMIFEVGSMGGRSTCA